MATNPLRNEVLALYRRCLRLSRTWEAVEVINTKTEQNFIKDESKRLFRENRKVTGHKVIQEHIREGEARITMAEHYRNPYPRPVNLPPKSFSVKDGKVGKAIKKKNEMSRPIYNKSIDESK